jgi:hypothetical protein
VERDSFIPGLRFCAVVACAGLVLLARPAFANGDMDTDAGPPPVPAQATSPSTSTSDDDADLAVKLPNFFGLSGMQDMIDARIPTGLTIRGGVRLEQTKSDLHGPLMNFKADQLNLQAYAGVAALELFEVGARLPFEINHTSKGLRIDGGHTRKDGDTFGDLDVGGKFSIRFGPLALAPYLVATLPSGDRRFNNTAGGRVGGAATVSILKSIVNFHANVDGAWLEGGDWAIDFRTGVSVVPLATKILLLRPYVFLNGRQSLAKNAGTDLRVAAGVQGLLLDFITVEAGGSYRFMNGTTPHDLEIDDGTWAFNIGAGVAF